MSNSIYSLWVAPKYESDLYKDLSNLIKDLAVRFSAPVFEPHVTLLGDIKIDETGIISKTEELANLISPYKITLDFLDYTDNLYQTLVVRTLASKEVVMANKNARDMFDNHSGTLYVPHISLLYKTGIENRIKQDLIAEIGDRFKGVNFQVESIQISEQVSGGRIEDWKLIKEVGLNGR